jgi:hypothetical protein
MKKNRPDLRTVLTSKPISKGNMLISRRSLENDPLMQTLNETIRQIHAEGRTMFQSPTATTGSNSNNSTEQEKSLKPSTGSPTPHLDAAPPLAAGDNAVADREA